MNESSIELSCPRCQARLVVEPDQAGETVPCPRCESPLLVPGQSSRRENAADDLLDFDFDLTGEDTVKSENAGDAPSEPIKQKYSGYDEPPPAPDDDPLLAMPADNDADEVDIGVTPVDDEEADENSASEPEADDFSDDLDALFAQPAKEAPAAAPKKEDPFEMDRFAPLRIEGISMGDADFVVTCHLCGTRLPARRSEIGSQIRCNDCHSMVDVDAPPAELKVKPSAGKKSPTITPEKKSDEDSGGYRLEPPVELPRLESSVDLAFENVSPEDATSAAGSSFGGQEAGESPGVTEESFGSRDVGLESPADDLLAPLEPVVDEPASVPTGRTKPALPKARRPEVAESTSRSRPVRDTTTEPDDDEQLRRPWQEADGKDLKSPFDGFGGWLANVGRVLASGHIALRVAMGAIGLAAMYAIAGTAMGFFGEESTLMQNFGGFILYAVAGVPLLVTLMFVGITAKSIIGDAIEQRPFAGEWPELSLDDLLSQFLYTATSFWLAAVPGLIAGQVLWIWLDSPMWMLICVVTSSLVLAPIFLTSVIFNGSPIMLVSTDALDSLWTLKNRWIRYWIAALVVSLIVSAAVPLGLPGILWGLLAGAIQLALLFGLYWMIGDQVAHVLRHIETRDESAVKK